MTWAAYVDESMRTNAGLYLLAAACVDSSDVEEVRSTVAQLGRPNRRFHWRDADSSERAKATGVVAGLPTLHLIVIASPLDPRRQERARRHCLRRLVFELESAGIGQVWLESRGYRQDLRDLQQVNVLRIQHAVSRTLTVGFAQPNDEPLLWVPDIVAGAVGGELDRGEVYAEQLVSVISRCHIDLR